MVRDLWLSFGNAEQTAGPQFRNEFKSFCRTICGIAHELSSAYNPTMSNGHAESAVNRNIKHMIIKCKKSKTQISTALAHFRNTPRQDGVSPAQLFLQRRIRINLPVLSKHLAPMNSEYMGDALTQRNLAYLQKSRSIRDQKCKPLALLEPGEKVLVQNDSTKLWDTKGLYRISPGRWTLIYSENFRRIDPTAQ